MAGIFYISFILAPLFLLCQICWSQSSDQTDPTSVNYKASAAKMKKWGGGLTLSTGRGLDELAEFSFSYDLTLSYRLSARSSLVGSTSFAHPENLETDQPENWGLRDTSLTYSRAAIFRSKFKTMTHFRGTLILPTSERSQINSTWSRLNLSFPTAKMWGGFRFVVSPGLRLAYHSYKTADDAGFRKNRPVGAPLGITVLKPLGRKRGSLFVSSSILGSWDYDGRFQSFQSVGLGYNVPVGKYAFSFGYRWGDQSNTSLEVFDDDRSSVFFSVSYFR